MRSSEIFQRGRYWLNPPDGDDCYGRCVVCGRRLGAVHPMVLVNISSGEVVTTDELVPPGHDVVEWGVGSECAKLPEVAPFVVSPDAIRSYFESREVL